jgi:hypothetical protein
MIVFLACNSSFTFVGGLGLEILIGMLDYPSFLAHCYN